MGNTRDTGYLRNLVAYDGSGNITLPANLTVTGSIVGYATTSYVTTQINNLINGAPGLLDTLDELAAALGDDANFASTITTSLAGKQSTLTFTGPLVNTSGTITITQSSGSTNGFLSNTDWTTFNSKQSTLTFSGPLVNTSGTISITQSSGSTNGYLSNTDWTTFNNKQAALSGTGFVKISGTTISYDNSTYLTTASASSTYQTILTNPVTGTGTNNYIPKFTTTGSTIGNSVVYDNGSQIGISQTTLFVKFSISDSLAATSVGSNYNPGIINIQNTNTTNGNLSLIGFQDASGFINLAAFGAINEVHSSSPNNVKGSLAFYTKNSGTSYVIEKMRLTASGNLGIGVADPDTTLEVRNPNLSTDTVNTLLTQRWSRQQTGAVKWGNSMDLLLGSYESGIISSRTRVDFRLANGNTDDPDTTVLTLQGNGNVGIGITSPSYKFSVNGIGSFAGSGTVTGTVYIQAGHQWSLNADQSGGGSPAFAGSGFYIKNENTSTIALGFNTGGAATFVSSVSATSFNANVSSFGTDISANSTIRVGSGFATQASIIFGDAGTPYWSVGRPAGSGNLSISSYALTALTIQPTTGNIGMGTTNPYTKLDVRGAIGMGGGATYPLNARLVKQGVTSVTFTATLGTIGAWRPGHVMIKVSGGQNGLQEYWAAWFFVRIIAYVASSVICTVVDSGGETGAVSFSSTSDTNSPQTVTFTLTDGGGTTNTIIADIDLTYNEGIVSLS
jgi:hypothetical protein